MPPLQFKVRLTTQVHEADENLDRAKQHWKTHGLGGQIALLPATVTLGIAVVAAAVIFAPTSTPRLGGKPSRSASRKLMPQAATTYGYTSKIPDSLEAKVYLIPARTQRMPDFKQLQPVGTLYTTEFNVPQHAFDAAKDRVPGVATSDLWFGIEYNGEFKLDRRGLYHFALSSGHGSKLFIDNRLVVDNDGAHDPGPPKTGDAVLTSGTHRVRLQYFRAPWCTVQLVVTVARENEPPQPFHIGSEL